MALLLPVRQFSVGRRSARATRKFWEEYMLKKFAASAAITIFACGLAGATELRLSHQFSTNDIRHRIAQMVADDVAAANLG